MVDSHGFTALMMASMNNNKACMGLLLTAGADRAALKADSLMQTIVNGSDTKMMNEELEQFHVALLVHHMICRGKLVNGRLHVYDGNGNTGGPMTFDDFHWNLVLHAFTTAVLIKQTVSLCTSKKEHKHQWNNALEELCLLGVEVIDMFHILSRDNIIEQSDDVKQAGKHYTLYDIPKDEGRRIVIDCEWDLFFDNGYKWLGELAVDMQQDIYSEAMADATKLKVAQNYINFIISKLNQLYDVGSIRNPDYRNPWILYILKEV